MRKRVTGKKAAALVMASLMIASMAIAGGVLVFRRKRTK